MFRALVDQYLQGRAALAPLQEELWTRLGGELHRFVAAHVSPTSAGDPLSQRIVKESYDDAMLVLC